MSIETCVRYGDCIEPGKESDSAVRFGPEAMHGECWHFAPLTKREVEQRRAERASLAKD